MATEGTIPAWDNLTVDEGVFADGDSEQEFFFRITQ